MHWASAGGVLGRKTRELTEADHAAADRVCEACAVWDGTPETLAELRVGGDWCVTMEVITPGEPCWADVLRVCDAIVQQEGHFMSNTGHIYTPGMIIRQGGRVSEDRRTLTFPDDMGRYAGEPGGGDPWDGMYDRRSSWTR
jgi:hypothetical protein